MLMTRRQFVSAAAGAALGSRVARPHAVAYDLVVRGGRVIDPSLGIDAVRDVAIAGGRIAAVEPGLDAGDAQVVNASGRIVVPGLIDVHTHYAREAQGPRICLEDGVTAWVDAGSAGADAIAGQVAVARAAPQQGRVLVNIGRQGILPGGDTMDLDLADVGAAEAHRHAAPAPLGAVPGHERVGVRIAILDEEVGGHQQQVRPHQFLHDPDQQLDFISVSL